MVFHARTKYVKLGMHFIREKVLVGHLVVHHVPSSEQLVHILTKPLSHVQFFILHSKLSVLILTLSVFFLFWGGGGLMDCDQLLVTDDAIAAVGKCADANGAQQTS